MRRRSPFYIEMISGKRKPKWIQETLKEAQEYVGNPKRDVRERKVPKSFVAIYLW
jgi:hypothetical protein